MYGDMWAKLQRAVAIWSGFGMTLTGVHTCGDYMFSGHTVVLTMLNFFVTECKWLGSQFSNVSQSVKPLKGTPKSKIHVFSSCLWCYLSVYIVVLWRCL